MNSEHKAHSIADIIRKKGASHILIQDLRELTSMTDFFVLCTVQVDVQAKALMQSIQEEMKIREIHLWHKEGQPEDQWILMDFVDVVVHIFRNEAREFYGLERLWGDAKITEIKDTDDS